MSTADNASFANFGKLVPGFDFLQNLAKQAAGSAAQSIPQMPNLGSWVAPTLNVEELDKRIQELKAVQFWLDQNATALKATIQALEVQKMTLATLKGMNFSMGDVANAFKLKVADSVAGGLQGVTDKARQFSGLEVPPTRYNKSDDAADPEPAEKSSAAAAQSSYTSSTSSASPTSPAGVVDPLQWWGALTQQFQTIAADAMKDVAKKAAINTTRNVATGLAKDAMKSATDMASGLAGNMAKGLADSAQKTVATGTRAVTSALSGALGSNQAWPAPVPTRASPSVKSSAKSPARKKPAAAAKKPARGAARKTSR